MAQLKHLFSGIIKGPRRKEQDTQHMALKGSWWHSDSHSRQAGAARTLPPVPQLPKDLGGGGLAELL